MPEGDRLEIEATLRDDLTAALARIQQRVDSLENEVKSLGRTGAKAGTEFSGGMDKAARSADEAGDQARQARRPVKELGDEAIKTGTKARVGATGLDKLARSARKNQRQFASFGPMLTTLKFAGITTGVFALVGGLSALAAGAGIAVGGLSPMVGILAAIPTLLLAAKLSTLAFKLAAEAMEPTLTRIKNQFTELGPVIAKGGLQKGLDYFANSLTRLAKLTGSGLAGLGAEIGLAARATGNIVKDRAFLDQVATIFAGLRPIVRDIAMGLLALGRALLNIVEGSLPMVQDMADTFRLIMEGLQGWTAAQLANGRMAAWLMKAWSIFTRSIGVLVDLFISLFNVLRIGAGYAGEMGESIESAAYKMRLWTGSAEGQARINQYFQDSLPALREMGRLLGMMVAGLGKLGSNQNVAPLLEQIRTEFAPALGEVIGQLSGQNGLGPALISAATALLQFVAALDFSGLTAFVQALAAFVEGIVWIMQNVPGASFVLSTLVAGFFAFKLLGPVFALVAGFGKAFTWMSQAVTGAQNLSRTQSLLRSAMLGLGRVFGMVGKGIIFVIRGIGAAFMANPVLAAIALIITAIVLLWENCAWFRDAVIAVWEAIKSAAVAAWDWIKNVVSTVVNAIVSTATSIWNTMVEVWNSVTGAIADAAKWLWENGIRPVWNVIASVAQVVWSIITGIVQTAVYIIVAIIALLATVMERFWQALVRIATWVWENVLLPIWTALRAAGIATWTAIQVAVQAVATAIQVAWNWVWTTVLLPIFTAIQTVATAVWNFIGMAAQAVVNAVSAGWNFLWGILQPIFSTIGSAGSAVWTAISDVAGVAVGIVKGAWEGISGFFSSLWEGISKVATGAWEGIGKAIKAVGDTVKGVWDAITGAIKAVWNFIANAWNSIPSITVPDWVPGIGGTTFGLPKLPTLWHGGEAPGGKAIVGEHGPEPVIVNGQFTGMVGTNGPEVATVPRGGYVVPNLSTLSALPGLTKTLPSSVAAAVARSVPGYAGALGGRSSSGGDDGLAHAVDRLAAAMGRQMPPVSVYGNGSAEDVYDAWKRFRREDEARGRYDYTPTGR